MARAFVEIIICAICAAILFWFYENPKPLASSTGDRLARNDLKNASIAQEAYRSDYGTYARSSEDLLKNKYGLWLSKGVSIRVISAGKNEYQMEAFHKNSDKKLVLLGPAGEIEKVPKPKASYPRSH